MDKGGIQAGIIGIVVFAIAAVGLGTYVVASDSFGSSVSGPDNLKGPPSEIVPSGADFVVSIDVNEIMGDSEFESLINKRLSSDSKFKPSNGEVSKDYLDFLKKFKNENWDLASSDINSVIVFGKQSAKLDGFSSEDLDEGYCAAVLSTDWSETELINAIENMGLGESISENSYKGVTVYTGAGDSFAQLAVLSEETFAIGNREAVKDIIDTKKGDMEGLSNPIKKELEKAGSGLVGFVWRVPENGISPEGAISLAGGSEFNKIEFL